VTLQIKIGWRKVKICQFGSAKWFCHSIFAHLAEIISTNDEYVTLHWTSWMRFISPMQWIHWTAAGTLKKCTAFRVLDELCNSLVNRVKSYLLTAPYFWLAILFHWSKWVGISSLPPTCRPCFSFMGGFGKKLVTKTWMWEIFLQGHIESIAGDTLRLVNGTAKINTY
jgi:hypothetical protein